MRLAKTAFLFALVGGLGVPHPAAAQSAIDLAKRATAQAKGSKNLEAYNTMRKAALKIWNAGPLVFREALFVKGPPEGYGIYDPRPDNTFKPGEKLFIYVEPVGFTWKLKNGLNRAELVSDLVLKDADGAVLGEQEGFGTFKFDSREKNMEVMTALTIDFAEAPAGKYVAELKFTDKLGEKSAKFELPFEIQSTEIKPSDAETP